MDNLFINRGEYRRLRQVALLPFAQHCLERVLDNPVYAAVQTAAQALGQVCPAYAAALSLAENKGRDTVAAKNELYKAVFKALDRLADAIEANAAGDPVYVTNAGMSVRQNGRRRFIDAPGVPEKVRLSLTKNSGEVQVEFEPVTGARMYALEWSDAAGEPNWQNGNYSTARRVLIQVPARREVRVRVCAIGSRNRCGNWSRYATLFVP